MLTFPTLITGTITGLRISAVDGTAFLDNCAALIHYADGNHRIEIYDASGRMLQGYLKAQGAGEGLGGEFITSVVNSGGVPYETLTINANGRDIDQAVNSATSGLLYSNVGLTLNALYRIDTALTLTSGMDPLLWTTKGTTGGSVSRWIKTLSGSETTYTTPFYNVATGFTDTGLGLYNSNTNCDYAVTWSAKPVTAPTTDGVTIVSTKDGATQSFASKDASFTYNAASYRYAIYDTLKVSRPTRYMGVSTHNI